MATRIIWHLKKQLGNQIPQLKYSQAKYCVLYKLNNCALTKFLKFQLVRLVTSISSHSVCLKCPFSFLFFLSPVKKLCNGDGLRKYSQSIWASPCPEEPGHIKEGGRKEQSLRALLDDKGETGCWRTQRNVIGLNSCRPQSSTWGGSKTAILGLKGQDFYETTKKSYL